MEHDAALELRLAEERRMAEEQTQKSLKELEAKLEARAKKELEQLRSRFKMMQGAMASSPVTSDNELGVSILT